MKTILLKTNDSTIKKATGILKRGEVVAFPTETVYGLGADALNAKAVAKIFEVKKRPFFDPLIVHVAGAEEAMGLWSKKSKIAQVLMEKFWPGPLTLVLPKSGKIPDIATAGLPSVAVRMPSHPVALDLIRELGHPIAAPSANPFGYTSPTTAQAVLEDLGGRIPLILDGGPCAHGVESTVIQIENEKCVLLRPGAVSVEEIEKLMNVKLVIPSEGQRPESRNLNCKIPRLATLARDDKNGRSRYQGPSKKNFRRTSLFSSPGLLESHYAPHTPLILIEKDLGSLRALKWKKPLNVGLLAFSSGMKSCLFRHIETLSRRKDLREAAANLFRAIRKLDKMGLDLIVAEPVPEEGLGLAIMDRLNKASGGRKLSVILSSLKANEESRK